MDGTVDREVGRPRPTAATWALVLTLVPLLGLVGLRLSVESSGWLLRPDAVVPAVVATCAASTLMALATCHWVRRPVGSGVRRATLVGAAVCLALGWALSGTAWTALATALPIAVGVGLHGPRRGEIIAGVIGVWGGIAIMTGLWALHRPADPGRSGPPDGWGGIAVTAGVGMSIVLATEIALFVAAVTLTTRPRQASTRTGAEDESTDLALTRERLRFATDLHDIQGHSLVAIRLKAELARRSLDRDPEVTRRELADIERIAGQAAADTRRLADGYRGLTFDAELANLERLLPAAGVDVEVERLGRPGEAWQGLFASLVRESASNVLRHTDATVVRVGVGTDRVSVENDGIRAPAVDAGRGSGLESLRRRFVESGGDVTWRVADGRFRVTGTTGSTT